MAQNFEKRCISCKKPGVEVIDDWESQQCPRCNDRDIERSNERRDWNYWHSEK